jgi:hypothetical protein
MEQFVTGNHRYFSAFGRIDESRTLGPNTQHFIFFVTYELVQ